MTDYVNNGDYGWEDDSAPSSPSLVFGLNEKVRLTGFEKKQDEKGQTYLEVTFTAPNEETKSKRYYEVVTAYRDNKEITDPTNPAVIEDRRKQSACITHVVSKFVDKDTFKSMPRAKSWEEYLDNLIKLLNDVAPNYTEVELDLLAHYQWSIGKNTNRTWPEIPKNMKQGAWLCHHVEPVGSWHEVRDDDATDNGFGLKYVDDEGNTHPFTRSGWFIRSNYANIQTKEDDGEDYGYDSEETSSEAAAEDGESW